MCVGRTSCELCIQIISILFTCLYNNSPTFYYLPKPLLVYGSMLLLSTLMLSSYSVIVVMLGYDWGLRMVINMPGSGLVFAAFEYPCMTIKEIIQYTSVHFTIYPSPYSCMSRWYYYRQ